MDQAPHTRRRRFDQEAGDADDQFRALMEGLRTTLPGVQVLFAFLLTLPFQPAFSDLDGGDRLAYAVAIYASAVASVLLIAPSVHQRVRAPISGITRRHLDHVQVAAWLAIAGTVVFLVALVAAVYLVSSVVFAHTAAVTASVVIAATAGWTWFVLPAVQFGRARPHS